MLRHLPVTLLLFLLTATLASAVTPALPLTFEQNQGQVTSQYAFLFRHNGTEALFSPTAVDLQFTGTRTTPGSHLGLRLLHESPAVRLTSEQPLATRTNYLFGADSSHWLRNIPNFSQVRYAAVYPGVDLVFHGNSTSLEHDFHVAPGADARQIAFRFEPAEATALTPSGDLSIRSGSSTLVLRHPFAYQQGSSGLERVAAAFTLSPDGTIAFRLAPYDHTRELVIDPALTYATYLDRLDLRVTAIATDAAGATYITGLTFISTYGVTPGAFQTTCTACVNNKPATFVTKLDPTGTHVLYSTFLGGSDYTEPFALAVDSLGDAIIGGRTSAADFPVKNPIAAGTLSPNAFYNGFVSSLSPDGSTLNFSSVLQEDAIVTAVAAGPSNNVFFSGQTDSSAYPVTAGALNSGTPQYPNNIAFVTELSSAGALVYSALVGNVDPQNGGGGNIGVFGIAVDPQGEATITGAAGTLWPTTPGAYQPTIPGQMPYSAPFVTRLAADGSHLLFSTFVGVGLGQAITLESTGIVDLLSNTGDQADTYAAYLSRLSADGSQLLQSTTIGSSSGAGFSLVGNTPTNLTADSSGNLWISGTTNDPNYPLLHPLQGIDSGSSNFTGFVSEYDPTATTLKFSTLYNSRTLTGLAVDPTGIIHIAGTTIDPVYTSPNALIPSVTAPPPLVTYTYGFLALINSSQQSAAVCAQPSTFGTINTVVGTPATSTITFSNCGDLPLVLSSMQSSSSAFTIQDPTSACGSSIAPGASCDITATFNPVQSGQISTILTLHTNSSIPVAIVSLAGNGLPAPPTLSPSTLTFTTAPGTAAATQTITFTNVSDVAFTINNIGVTQPFTVINNCPYQLAPAAACTITVGFTSSTAGTVTGTLTVNDTATNQMQTTSLTGIAANPAVSIGPITPAAATQTVAVGQTATYTLATSSVGNFSGIATLTCTSLPQYSACSFAPSTVTLTAGSRTPVTLTITTKQTTTASLNTNAGLVALALLGLPLLPLFRRRTPALLLALFVLALAPATALLGCSGGGSSSNRTSPAPTAFFTPAGTYTVNVVATSATESVSTPVTLVVQ